MSIKIKGGVGCKFYKNSGEEGVVIFIGIKGIGRL